MPSDFGRSTAAVNAEAAAVTALVNGGYLRVYDGVKPGDTDDPVTTQQLLAELRWGSPAFAAPVNGVAAAHPITPEPAARATSTATWFRAVAVDETPAFDGTAGTAGCDLTLDTTAAIVLNAIVRVSAGAYRARKR